MPARRTHRRRGGRKPKMTKRGVRKVVNSVLDKRIEKKYYAPETGFFEIDGSAAITLGTNFDLASTETQFNLDIDQGDGQAERIGSKVTLMSWKLNWLDYGADSMYRLLVVYFPNGTGSNFSTALGQSFINTFNPSKKDHSDSYRILYDRIHKLDVSQDLAKLRKINLPVKGLVVQYDDDTDDVLSGMIKFIIQTANSTNGGVIGDFQGVSKLVYTDA